MSLEISHCTGYLQPKLLEIAEKIYPYDGFCYPSIEKYARKFLREKCGIPMPVQSKDIRIMANHDGHGNLWGIIRIRDELVGHFGHTYPRQHPLNRRHLERDYLDPVRLRLNGLKERQKKICVQAGIGASMFSLGLLTASLLLGGPILVPVMFCLSAILLSITKLPEMLIWKELSAQHSELFIRKSYVDYYAMEWSR